MQTFGDAQSPRPQLLRRLKFANITHTTLQLDHELDSLGVVPVQILGEIINRSCEVLSCLFDVTPVRRDL